MIPHYPFQNNRTTLVTRTAVPIPTFTSSIPPDELQSLNVNHFGTPALDKFPTFLIKSYKANYLGMKIMKAFLMQVKNCGGCDNALGHGKKLVFLQTARDVLFDSNGVLNHVRKPVMKTFRVKVNEGLKLLKSYLKEEGGPFPEHLREIILMYQELKNPASIAVRRSRKKPQDDEILRPRQIMKDFAEIGYSIDEDNVGSNEDNEDNVDNDDGMEDTEERKKKSKKRKVNSSIEEHINYKTDFDRKRSRAHLDLLKKERDSVKEEATNERDPSMKAILIEDYKTLHKMFIEKLTEFTTR